MIWANAKCSEKMGMVRQMEHPAMIPTSRKWSGDSWRSRSRRDLSMNVNEDGKSIEVITLSTGQRRASFEE